MAEFIEFLSASALKDLEKANSELVTMVANVDKVSQKMKGISTPSGSDSAVKSLTEQYKQQEKVIQNLQKQLTSLNATKKQTALRTSEEIVNNRALAQNADLAAKANSTLVGAYQRLNAQHQMSAKNLQNLVARGKLATQTQKQYDAEIRNAQRDFTNLNNRILKADSAVGKFNRNVGNYPQRAISGVRDLIGAFGVVGGLTAVAAIGRDIFNTTKELQSLDLALKQVTESNEVFAESQAFLRDISERFGVEINGLTKQFTQFYVSAKDKISGKEIQQIFESVAKSAGFMGLSVEAQERAFVALNQMMSKGTVSAEELKGQLGEALPGAFGIMAKAMGTTEQGLSKLMQDGKVLAADVLPRFAKELERAYGIENKDRVESLAASQTRLSNAWTGFIRELNEGSGVITKVFSGFIDWIGKAVEGLTLLMATEAKRDKIFGESTQNTAYKEALKSYESMTAAERKLQAEFNKREILEDIRETVAANKILIAQGKEIEKQRNGITTGVGRELLNTQLKENNKLVIANNQSIYFNRGLLAAANEVLKESTEKTSANTGVTDANTKAKKEQAKAIKEVDDVETNSKDAFERNISALEGQLNKISILNPQYEFLAFQLKIVKDAYSALYGEVEKSNEQTEKRAKFGTEEYFEAQIAALKAEQGAVADSTEQYQLYDRLIKSVQDQLDALRGKTKEATEATNELKEATDEWLQGFIDSFAGDTGFVTLFDVLQNKIKGFGEDWEETLVGIMEITQEAYAFINQAQEAQYNSNLQRLERQKEIAIQFAGDSATARAEIERQYDERRKQMDRQRAEQQKRAAIFNAVINTAQAVVAALPNIPLSVAIGLIGAAQIAMIASQPIPAYAVGTDNAKEGFAWTQEKGAEIITDKNGKVKSLGSNKGAQLTYMNKGDKVYTASESEMMFNSDLNNIFANNGILPSIVVNNDNSDVKNEIKALGRIIQSKESITLVRDEKGERIYKKSQGQRQQMLNARLNIKGYEL